MFASLFYAYRPPVLEVEYYLLISPVHIIYFIMSKFHLSHHGKRIPRTTTVRPLPLPYMPMFFLGEKDTEGGSEVCISGMVVVGVGYGAVTTSFLPMYNLIRLITG